METRNNIINITPEALERFNKISSDEGNILLVLREKGCSGFSYSLEIDENQIQTNFILFDGFKLFYDPNDVIFLEGMEIDYQENLMGGRFAFNNAHYVTCGCGGSFRNG